MSEVPLFPPHQHLKPYAQDPMGQPTRVQALRILRAIEGAGRSRGSLVSRIRRRGSESPAATLQSA